ncbi:hypothetical protein LVD17_24625 [Fulvivirga ulvae]|uniref:SpvB/TcaC N-terminal domain-containing protein n=1 Tax=Fulvivirga ulvae TaxID=2904245 RepID=UPI001F242D64|nr:SpvB/TcaC N-terminal domain-containing protein [Fulvivirga ulvae]UII31482.1 hypothetical protein LVD17_24625 [Fulvivirga ulvae]
MPQEISFRQVDFSELKMPVESSVNPQTGTAVTNIQIPVTPGRLGFQPTLALSYSSGAGNSPFGLGWNLQGLPSIGLSLKDGYPKYDGADKYAFNGQTLIPWLIDADGRWTHRSAETENYFIYYYRISRDPALTRFERWVHKTNRQMHWRLHDRNNIVIVFGRKADNSTKVYNPSAEDEVFQWLPEAYYDNSGNAIVYEYIEEDFTHVDSGSSFERNRVRRGQNAQKYLKRILYGNETSLLPHDPIPSENWLFEVVFNYGEHDEVEGMPLYTAIPQNMPVRPDPFSSYIAGFEQRTYRLCYGIMMYHHMEELGTDPTLVGYMKLEYHPADVGTTLQNAYYTAYRSGEGSYRRKSLPTVYFEYTAPSPESSFNELPVQSMDNVPFGLGGLNYKWIDLYGEGVPGVLFESDEVWYYKPNLGNGMLGKQQKVASKPSTAYGQYALSDFDNDGNLNLVVLQGKESGYFEYDRDKRQWSNFKAFEAAPHVRPMDAHTRLIDITGNGCSDILTVEEDRIIWYPSKGKEGFGNPVQISKPVSNGVSQAPVLGGYPMLDYFFADMNGSGLPDQVRVYNGRVEYWPNMGNGKFASGIVMEGSPDLDFGFELDASRIRLVDLDGSGTADLLYIGKGEIKYWINASGNRFTEEVTIKGLPFIDNISSVQVLDLLGDGTPCLVWSSALSAHADSPIHYLRLTGGVKPRLMVQVQNSMGLETLFHYGYSGTHYLRDKSGERSWLTKLPAHRVIVDRLEIVDHIGNTRFSQRFDYHDGFYDGEERAFSGFCLVDQYDSDSYRGTSAIPETEFSDPVCRRTWYHNGAPGWQKAREKSYYEEDPYSIQLPDFYLENGGEMKPLEFFDAVRSLSGQPVRTETYGLTAEGNRKPHPFQVEHSNYTIRRVQPGNKETDAAFTVFQRESLNIIYEEDPSDPRISHSFNLEVDIYGVTRKQCAISYPRLPADALTEQQDFHLRASIIEVAGYDAQDRYELGIELENRSYELNYATRPPSGQLYRFDVVRHLVESTTAMAINFDEEFTADEQARLIRWTKNYYWNDDRTEELPWGTVGAKVLVHHQETAVFHDNFLSNTLGERYSATDLVDGHYRFHDELWWQSSPVFHYLAAERFYLPYMEVQPDGGYTEYTFDNHHLTMIGTTAILVGTMGEELSRNTTSAEIDYHVIAPKSIRDANNNTSEVSYDPFGVIILSSIHGEILSETGVAQPYGHSRLSDYTAPSGIDFNRILDNPEDYIQECASFFYYELDSWHVDEAPLRSIAIAREQWVNDGEGHYQPESTHQISVEYKDGFSRTIQSKKLVEGGPETIQYNDEGNVVVSSGGEPVLVETDELRWLVSGKVVFNNKQEPVRQFEPYFSPIVTFENDEALETFGQSGLIEYDAPGRKKKVIMADGTESRVEYTAWETRQYDANDSVEDSLYQLRIEAEYPVGSPERLALQKSLAHRDTPQISHIDGLGRTFLTEESDEAGNIRRNRVVMDAPGNPKQIIDARELPVFTYVRDMQGRIFHEQSVDAGPKWQFVNAQDQTIHTWDGRGIHQQMTYDTWGRIMQKYVDGALGMNHLTEMYFYGEDASVADAEQRNLKGQLVRFYDQAGVSQIHRMDLIGNVLEKSRRLLDDYRNIPDWTHEATMHWMPDTFINTTKYDALGRPVEQHLPDETTRIFSYRQSGALDRFLLSTGDGELVEQPVSHHHVYNAKGQLRETRLGNGVIQRFEYDPLSYRLKRKHAYKPATSSAPSKQYQNAYYTYDAVGNITHITDSAQPNGTILFARPRVNQYSYDAFYQLTVVEGRTHQALQRMDYAHAPDAPGFIKGTHHINTSNMDLITSYTRRYTYDIAGNMRSMVHNSGLRPSEVFRWRRDYQVAEDSNRSVEGTDLSTFDTNGNPASLSHLHRVDWNYLNQLSSAVIVPRSAGNDDAEYYVYGGDGQRVRKITTRETSGGTQTIEKIYLDGCEIKRVHEGTTLILERYSSHLSDGSQKVAIMHRWTTDRSGRETTELNTHKIHYQLNDHLGSSAFELNEDGDIISYEEYFAFGGAAFIYGDNLTDVRARDYRYTGKERDDATKLYYYGFRYYAPWLCRWLNPDPIGPEDGLNLYQFVHNNPVNEVDPNGLQSSVTSPAQAVETGSFSRTWVDPGGVEHTFTDRASETEYLESFIESHRRDESPPRIIYQGIEYNISDINEVARFWTALAINDIEHMMGEEHTSGDAIEEVAGGDDSQTEQESGGGGDSGTGLGSEGNGGDVDDGSSTSGGGTGGNVRTGSEHGGESSGRSHDESVGRGSGIGRRLGSPGGSGEGRRGSTHHPDRIPGVPVGTEPLEAGQTPQHGSTDPAASPQGSPDGALLGPEEVNSELPVGAGDPNGSVDGTPGGSANSSDPVEEMQWWHWVIIGVVVLALVLVTAGAAAYMMGVAGAVGGVAIGVSAEAAVIIGGGIGLVGGVVSDAAIQALNLGFGTQREFDWGQLAFSGVTGMFTGGLGGYASAGTTAARQLTMGSMARASAARFGAGAAEGGGMELLRQGVMGEDLNLQSVGVNALIGGGMQAAVGGGFDLWAARSRATGVHGSTSTVGQTRAGRQVVDVSDGVPEQIHRPVIDGNEIEVGPAYASYEEASGQGNHIAEIIVRETDGTEISRWWEVSEIGLPSKLGHTEQKALMRIRLGSDIELEIRGFHPPCPYSSGCNNTMEAMAEMFGMNITYRYFLSDENGGFRGQVVRFFQGGD